MGDNFSWRTYFHGGAEDFPETWRASPGDRIKQTNLSAVYYSHVNDRWTVTISTPVIKEDADGQEGKFLGVIGLSADVHRFVDLQDMKGHQFAVLVDWRPGPNKGLILQHPLFEQMLADHKEVPERFQTYRLKEDDLPRSREQRGHYIDPLAKDPQVAEYDKRWLAESLGRYSRRPDRLDRDRPRFVRQRDRAHARPTETQPLIEHALGGRADRAIRRCSGHW